MHVLLLAPGTRGDVAPATGLTAAFVADGHEVTVVAGSEYGALVTESGGKHVAISAPLAPASGSTSGVRAYLAVLRTYMDSAAAAALLAAPGADVILTNAISPYGHDIAEHLGVPSAEALLQPAHPSRAYPPMIASARDLGAVGNPLAGRLARMVPTPYDPAFARVRSELGLAPESRRSAQRRRRAQGIPVHHGISPVVLPRPADWPAALSLDGFWWPPTPPRWTPPAPLQEFLAAGRAPVVVTLGSLPPGASVGGAISAALAAGTTRFVLQGDDLRQVAERLGPDRALHVGDVPHAWLLPRAAAVVHQAGAGITAAALRAGIPSVPLPIHTDQPFWARRLTQLRAGTSPLPVKQVTGETLAARIEEAASSSALRDGAEAVRDAMANEDGTAPLRAWLATLA
ncbi:glycosyltransferase [Cellulomonas sp.]|uniref:glycosyltransferase n=1 Tax=Cellulomonas sp. TaxID=40001 RepID=UPI003BAD5058